MFEGQRPSFKNKIERGACPAPVRPLRQESTLRLGKPVRRFF